MATARGAPQTTTALPGAARIRAQQDWSARNGQRIIPRPAPASMSRCFSGRLHRARPGLKWRETRRLPARPPRSPAAMTSPAETPPEARAVRELAAAYEKMTEQIGKVIVGQKQVIEQLLMALFSRGHCLLVGVPGLAKTLLVSTVSKILHLSFKRIQFTPDLMPADITGTDILQDDPETGRRKFVFLSGPIFANMILADEINRTPPKTQAALLEAMQEHHVTAGAQTYHLPEPFFVLATQNPIEQEGTYPLPEAQLDRFMFNIKVGYPSRAEEIEIMIRTTSTQWVELQAQLDGGQIQRLQEVVRQVVVADHIFEYVADLVRAT